MVSVSIVVPVYNSEKYIALALQGVVSQTFMDFEVIVVDDFSVDGSASIVETFCSRDPRFFLVRNKENIGAAKCRDKAVQLSKGRYIAFLDADDFWLPQKLQKQIGMMQNAGAAMSCTAVDIVDSSGAILGARDVPAIITYDILAKRTPVVNSTVILDSCQVGRVSVPDIRRRQDFALWLKIIREHGPALGIPEKLGGYRVHEGSLSRNKFISAVYTWKVLRDLESLSFFRAMYYFSFYSLKGVFGRIRGLN